MNDLEQAISELKWAVDDATARLNIKSQTAELAALEEQMSKPNFWDDANKAQTLSKRHAQLKAAIEPWVELSKEVVELQEFASMDDDALTAEIKQRLNRAQKSLDEHKSELSLSGKYDAYDAIVNIHAGAGGLDAQDWAQMLMKMYAKWADKEELSLEVIDESTGEEAGIKNASISIGGRFAYGRLKGEHGVHRLVRMSPFNSANSRETSFAQVEVLPQIDEPSELELDEKDLKIDVYRAGGRGGQSVNTTDSAVRITHVPTGISVAIQNERSQLQNKETALKLIRSKLAQLAVEQHADALSKIKGPSKEAAWGNQIRSYVLHPYTMVKDNRTKFQTSDVDGVLGGDLNEFIEAYLATLLGDSN